MEAGILDAAMAAGERAAALEVEADAAVVGLVVAATEEEVVEEVVVEEEAGAEGKLEVRPAASAAAAALV